MPAKALVLVRPRVFLQLSRPFLQLALLRCHIAGAPEIPECRPAKNVGGARVGDLPNGAELVLLAKAVKPEGEVLVADANNRVGECESDSLRERRQRLEGEAEEVFVRDDSKVCDHF